MESGLVLTCLGGPNQKMTYKKSRVGSSSLDKIFTYLNQKNQTLLRKFDPRSGSDERQYCSSELNLPVGQIARTEYSSYYQYHSSGDNKKFMKISQIMKSIKDINRILKINDELSPLKRNTSVGELNLGRRGLYPNINSFNTRNDSSDSLLKSRKQLDILRYILSYADGKHNIFDISNISGYSIDEIKKILKICIKKKLIKKNKCYF